MPDQTKPPMELSEKEKAKLIDPFSDAFDSISEMPKPIAQNVEKLDIDDSTTLVDPLQELLADIDPNAPENQVTEEFTSEASTEIVQPAPTKQVLSPEELEEVTMLANMQNAKHLGWEVSAEEYQAYSSSVFEQMLANQRANLWQVKLLQARYQILSLESPDVQLPMNAADLASLFDAVEEHEKKHADEQGDTLAAFFKNQAKEVGWRIPKDIQDDLSATRLALVDQVAIFNSMKAIEEEAAAVKWEGYKQLSTPYSIEKLTELQQGFDFHRNYMDLEQASKSCKEVTLWAPELPNAPHTRLVVEEYCFKVRHQLGLHNQLLDKQQQLPKKERDKFTLPRPPFHQENVAEFTGQVDLRLTEIEAFKRSVRRAMRLLRLGGICVVVATLTVWEISLALHAAELKVRAAAIGVELKNMQFPYLPEPVEKAEKMLDTQERLMPHVAVLQERAARKGLDLSNLIRPYTHKTITRWEHALQNFELTKVGSAQYIRGSKVGERDERPLHKVTISRPFYIMQTEVTQGLYEAMMNSNPAKMKDCGPNCPVENVSWFDALKFANRLSIMSNLEPCYQISGYNVNWSKGLDCEGYRLPTEAEWEYAARANSKFAFAGSFQADKVAWALPWSREKMQPVASLKSNGFDLYDMNGSVSEWCWDWYGAYRKGSFADPMGYRRGTERVKRGGNYQYKSVTLSKRASMLPDKHSPGVGLRVVRTAFR